MSYEIDGIIQIDFDEFQELLKKDAAEPIIIDVREPEEYEEAHIPNLPLLPMNNIPQVMDELDKNKEYVFVCRSGNRSQHVALYLKQNGFEKVRNYAGGMLGWQGQTETGPANVINDVKELYKK